MGEQEIVDQFHAARQRSKWQTGLFWIAFILISGSAEIFHFDKTFTGAMILGIAAFLWLVQKLSGDSNDGTTCPFCGAPVPAPLFFRDQSFCRRCGKRLA